MRYLLSAIALASLLSTPSLATPCRGANGKFVKCEKTAPIKKGPCKDAHGKFVKCPK